MPVLLVPALLRLLALLALVMLISSQQRGHGCHLAELSPQVCGCEGSNDQVFSSKRHAPHL